MSVVIDGTAGITTPALSSSGAVTASTLPVTPGEVSGLTVTSPQTTPLPGTASLLSYTHGLGITPLSAELEIICLTAEFGYSSGDVVTPFAGSNAAYDTPFTLRKTTTVVEARTGANTAFRVLNHTTGAVASVTAANWAWRFKLRTS